MADVFFYSSEGAKEQITRLFNFAWPTAAALWNLRWQVNGFLAEVPSASKDEISNRFLFGSDIPTSDLKRTFQEMSWEDDKQKFAEFILLSAVSVYEHWAERLVEEAGLVSSGARKLQFPDKPSAPGAQTFITQSISNKLPATSVDLYPSYKAKRKYALSRLDNLLLCFRYFKEIRNALMHAGGLASEYTEATYLAFKPVSDRNSLGMRGNLETFPITSGEQVTLSLRGVVGFTDVLIRLIHTIDAELMQSMGAASTLKRRLSGRSFPRMLPADRQKRNAVIRSRCEKSYLSKPATTEHLYEFMRSEGLIQI